MNTIAQRKTVALESLSSQFSHDKITMEEYERLVDYITRAQTERELRIIEKMIADTALLSAGAAEPSYQNGQSPLPFSGRRGDDRLADIITVLSSRLTNGLLLQRQQNFITLMADHRITVNAGDLPPGRTVIHTLTILGSTTIFVEPGITVRVAASPLLGSVDAARGLSTRSAPGKPELLITGLALCGSIMVMLKK
ncbi:MAG: cell wall-active antibiotics response protein [Spirochaetaceae bacterium]|jgi:hypothetical protein|nr:cell wall-active antibiotics response protein [Spirochaetaceae bacterium]